MRELLIAEGRQTSYVLTAETIADKFCSILNEVLAQTVLCEIVERNACEPDPMVCHSNDFCDASGIMFSAFQSLGVEPVDHEGVIFDDVLKMWNEAWAIAKSSGFKPGNWPVH